MGCEPNH
jgi:hypothetical protein